ncbi:phosphonate C-P lyase system protein PhnH [Paenibacillus jiagnxiensis]|uniref:phosphonate C-P lyase system protein PhnH n=1 Tax=Paenibacillus jiagnxiensis TaxID=3228926 RepID=UPI00339E84A8
MLNQVHDIQQVYRKVVDALSRPGRVQDLSDVAGKEERRKDIYPATLVLARMLLDTEVTFKVFAENEEELTQLIRRLTYAKQAGASDADYIFIAHTALDDHLNEALHMAKIGDLDNPHQSATLIVELPSVYGGEQRILKGPGIEHTAVCAAQAPAGWERVREERNLEYPLGVDLIFTDAAQLLLALPRTTRIEMEVQH